MIHLRSLLAASLLAACVVPGCSGKTEPAKGQLMVTLQTDMALPKDVDQVRVEILSYGSVQFSNTYEVGAGKLLIPATLGLIVGEDPARPVSIRILALQQGKARMLREVVTTIPAQRVATLRIPIQWLCDGSVTETAPGQYGSTCPEGQTCLAGRCTEQKVEEATLPSYDPALIFGGGTGTGDGACFDTEGCFSGASLVPVDAKDCSVEKPASGEANLALIPRDKKAGICDAQRCYIPLDRSDDAGFREANGRLSLPPRVCELISSGALEGVALSTRCPAKTDALPTCGPWSSTGKSAQPGNPLLAACNAYEEAVCSYLERCDTGEWSNIGGSQCKERGALFCGAILEFPGLGVSEAAFQQATELLAGGSCNSKAMLSALYGLLGGVEGSLPQGSPCLVNGQCQSSRCLAQQQDTCGVCGPSDPSKTKPFSKKQGEPCSSVYSHEECALDLVCALPGPTCQPGAQKGASCSEASPCSLEFDCVLSGDKATCRPRDAQENQPCQEYSDPVQQFPGCDASKGLTCLQGTCRKLSQVGQPCGDVGGSVASSASLEGCLGGYCSFEGDALPVCKPFLSEGASCQEDAQCLWPSVCTGNTCKVLSFAELCGGSGGSGGTGGSGGSSGTDVCKECAQERCSDSYEVCLQSPQCNAAQQCILEKCHGVNDTNELFACAASACGISEVIPDGLVNLAYCLLDQCAAGECISLGSGGMGGGGAGGSPECLPEVCDGKDNDCNGLVDEGFDLMNDPLNCGFCGNACSAEQSCSSGVCMSTCQEGQVQCSGQCVDLQSNNQHCGSCGNNCSPEQSCSSGQCVNLGDGGAGDSGGPECQPEICDGKDNDCNGLIDDINFMKDPLNCGACDVVCSQGQVCENGVCLGGAD